LLLLTDNHPWNSSHLALRPREIISIPHDSEEDPYEGTTEHVGASVAEIRDTGGCHEACKQEWRGSEKIRVHMLPVGRVWSKEAETAREIEG
jgi:hypothetical protein